MSFFNVEQFPDWNVFAERDVPLDMSGFLAPSSEVGAIMQRHEEALAQERQDAERAQHALLLVLVQQALFVHHFETILHDVEDSLTQSTLMKVYRQLRITKDQMLDTLRQAGVEIENPLGKPYQQVKDRVEVEGWRHSKEFATEVVVEVREPIVMYRAALIHLGRVTMGAPLAEDEGTAMPEI